MLVYVSLTSVYRWLMSTWNSDKALFNKLSYGVKVKVGKGEMDLYKR